MGGNNYENDDLKGIGADEQPPIIQPVNNEPEVGEFEEMADDMSKCVEVLEEEEGKDAPLTVKFRNLAEAMKAISSEEMDKVENIMQKYGMKVEAMLEAALEEVVEEDGSPNANL